jgi:ferredoxin-thioredoxin reductase catalytic subunit
MDEKQLIEISKKYAESQDFKLNPDKKTLDRIIKGLLENEKKYGFKYCPCRMVTGDPEKDKPKICPCKWHKDEIKRMGHCLCGLFVKR